MPYSFHARLSFFFFLFLTKLSLGVFAQAIQEFFMAEEWVKDAQNEARLMDNLRAETNKSLTTVEIRNKELALKLATADKDRKGVEAGLRTAEVQAEEQCQKLHYIEIELAIAKQ